MWEGPPNSGLWGVLPLHPGLFAAGFEHTCVHSPHLLSVRSPASSFLLSSLSTWVCPFPSLPSAFPPRSILCFFLCVSPSLCLASNASSFADWSLHLRLGLPQRPPVQGTLGDPSVLRERTALSRCLFAEKLQLQPPPAQ